MDMSFFMRRRMGFMHLCISDMRKEREIMLIRIGQFLREKRGSDGPIGGTLFVIDKMFDFTKTDGFIEFMMLCVDKALYLGGDPCPMWRSMAERLDRTASALCDADARFRGETSDHFRGYCRHLSEIDMDGCRLLDMPKMQEAHSADLRPVMEESVRGGRDIGFWFDTDISRETAARRMVDDMARQLSNLKFVKEGRDYSISWYLTKSRYHEHVHDALNILMQAAVYMMNCASTRDRDAYSFDMSHMQEQIGMAKVIMERTKNVIGV